MGGLQCGRGHRFDAARQGYVSFAVGRRPSSQGDRPDMIAARERFLGAGHYAALADSLAGAAAAIASRAGAEAGILDVGAGPGYYAARVLDRIPGAVGIALDASKAAAKRAARAHPRLGAIVADASRELPIRSGSIAVALSVFAPRGAVEIQRVLAPRGGWLVALPAAGHLRELVRPLGLLHVEENKPERLRERVGGRFELVGEQRVERKLELDADDAADVVRMGPSAFHLAPDAIARRVARLGRFPASVTASFRVYRFEPIEAGRA